MGIRSYEALSYTWGSPGTPSTSFPRRFITLNGAKFEVRENLFQAFHYLALKSKERVLWIDAICIDQNDINERNHQLSRSSIGAGKAFRVVHECAGYINRIDGLRLNGRERSIELHKCLRYTTGYWQLRELLRRRLLVTGMDNSRDWSRIKNPSCLLQPHTLLGQLFSSFDAASREGATDRFCL
jgi:hypothetical protein